MAKDIKKILTSVGIDADDACLNKVIDELSGKDIEELMAEGRTKLASVPSGGSVAAAGAGGAAAGGAAPAEEAKKEEKKEESESAGRLAEIFRKIGDKEHTKVGLQ